MVLFDPVRWFSSFKIPYKLFTISLSFLLPIGVMLYFIVSSVSGYIQFATLEQYGNTYQRPLQELFNYIPQHERLVHSSAPKDERIVGQVLNLETAIDKVIANLEVVNGQIGKQLQLTEEGLKKRHRSNFHAGKLKADWESIKKNSLTAFWDDSDARHQILAADILAMISYVGDTSNLILDPDLDSYYLMDSTLLALPQNQNRITNVMRYGEKVFKDGALTLEERQQLMIYASHLEEFDLARVLNNATKYLNEDQNFYGTSFSLQRNIPPALETYRRSMRSFIDLIVRVVKSETIDASSMEEFVSLGSKAREESFKMWGISVNELDVLLAKRIDYYEHSRINALILTLLSLFVSIILVFWIMQSILKPLRELMAGVSRIANSKRPEPSGVLSSTPGVVEGLMEELNFVSDIDIQTNDEIGSLAAAFNDMTRALKESYGSLEEKVKQRTSELQASQEYSRSVIETATDAFISIDSEGSIIEWNRQAETMFGWTRLEVQGKFLSEVIIPSSYRAAYQENLKRFMETEKHSVSGQFLKLLALHRSGSEFSAEMTMWPIKNNESYQFNAFLRDITERQRMEDEIKKTNRDLLEHEKDLRATLLKLQKTYEDLKQAQSQLLQSEKMASIGQLAAGMAHEINNPVGFISSNIQVFQQYLGKLQKYANKIKDIQQVVKAGGDANSFQQCMAELERLSGEINLPSMLQDIETMLKESVQGVERVVRIINDLSNFSRVGDDITSLSSVHEIIEMSTTIVWNEIKYKVKLMRNYGDIPLVKCNPQQLGQVIINLLINASQAMSERGVVEIKTSHDESFVYIQVSDAGKGIPQENLVKVFDPFFTTKPAGKGTGLGLSISYDIIKKHKGEITVASVVGKGTTFTIKLPLNDS